jgi:cyanophycinase-like exopeptidase
MAFGEWALVRPMGASRGMPSAWSPGLNLMPGVGVIPHYDRFGPERTMARVADAPARLLVLGIDEDTAIVRVRGKAGQVRGRGTVTVWRNGEPTVFKHGDTIPLDLLPLP